MRWLGLEEGGGSAGMCIYYDLWCRVCTTTYNPVSVPRKHRGEGGRPCRYDRRPRPSLVLASAGSSRRVGGVGRSTVVG